MIVNIDTRFDTRVRRGPTSFALYAHYERCVRSEQNSCDHCNVTTTLTLHPVLLHVLDLCDALSEVGGEACSVLLARRREDDQHLPLSPGVRRRESDTVRVVWVRHKHTDVTHCDPEASVLAAKG